MRLHGLRVTQTRREMLWADPRENMTHQEAPGSTQTDPDDLQVVPDYSTCEGQPLPAAFNHRAMDAAGPVGGANGRAAHRVLGNRFAIPTAPTAQTEGFANGLERNGGTTHTLPATRSGRFSNVHHWPGLDVR